MSTSVTRESAGFNWARWWICLVALLVTLPGLTAGSRDALAFTSNNVPLDNWSYEALDKLAGFGLIHSDIHGTRPYSRLEVARLVNEALNCKEEQKLQLPPLIEHLLKRFQREFKEELTVYGRGRDDEPAALVFKPIEEARTRYVYSEGQPRDFLNVNGGVKQYPLAPGGIVATEGTPLVYNNDGVVYGKGNNFSLQFASSFELWDVFSGYVEPIMIERENATGGRITGGNPFTVGSLSNTDLELLKGYAKFNPFDFFEAEFGRDSMWWGQGYSGTLILTNNAAPLDMLKFSNPTPALLPWYFSYLGPFKYSVFCALLEDDRDFPRTRFAGTRVDFKPIPDLEIGLSHTFMFGGEGGPSSGGALEFLKLAGLTEFSTGNQHHMVALDFRYRMPFLWNTEFYGEWGGNDAGLKPNIREFLVQDIGYLLGIYIPKVTPDGCTDLRIEYTDNVNEGGPGSKINGMWYTHGVYTTGVTYDGLILGDHIGPDARDALMRVSRYLRDNLKAGLNIEYTERGANLGQAVERVYQTSTDLTWDINAALSAMVRYGWADVENFDLVKGDTRQDNLLMVELKYTF